MVKESQTARKKEEKDKEKEQKTSKKKKRIKGTGLAGSTRE